MMKFNVFLPMTALISTAAEPSSLYDRDLYAWAQQHAMLLREKQFDRLDTVHLIEELADMGKSEKRALASHLQNLLMHLLKWQFQPTKQTPSWRYSIRNARRSVNEIIRDSPSLTHYLGDHLADNYAIALHDAADETGLEVATFPRDCAYSLAQIRETGWLPSRPST